jgi:hypothetical protein
MKKAILVVFLLTVVLVGAGSAQRPNIFAPQATAKGPIAEVVNSMVTAFNKKDAAFFEKAIAPEAVWLDEDGHHLLATVWINRLLSANPPRKLTISNLRVENWDNAGWAGFNYVLEATNQVHGINTIVFKKSGNDWRIVMIHGAVDTAIVNH